MIQDFKKEIHAEQFKKFYNKLFVERCPIDEFTATDFTAPVFKIDAPQHFNKVAQDIHWTRLALTATDTPPFTVASLKVEFINAFMLQYLVAILRGANVDIPDTEDGKRGARDVSPFADQEVRRGCAGIEEGALRRDDVM